MFRMKNFFVISRCRQDRLLGFVGENRSRGFTVGIEDKTIPEGWEFRLDLHYEKGGEDILLLTQEGRILSTEIVRPVVQKSGWAEAQIRATKGEQVKCSNVFSLYVSASIEAAAAFDRLAPTEFEQLEGRLTELLHAGEAASEAASECAESAVAAAAGVQEARDASVAAMGRAEAAAAGAETARQAAQRAAEDAAEAVVPAAVEAVRAATADILSEAETARDAAAASARAAAESIEHGPQIVEGEWMIYRNGAYEHTFVYAEGSIGPRGPQGLPGPKGETGATGPKGDAYILTEADREDIARRVLGELPQSEREAF